jgi:hypothetical protein
MKYVGVITDNEYVRAYNAMNRIERAKFLVTDPYEAIQVKWVKEDKDYGEYTNWMKNKILTLVVDF